MKRERKLRKQRRKRYKKFSSIVYWEGNLNDKIEKGDFYERKKSGINSYWDYYFSKYIGYYCVIDIFCRL